VRVPFWSDGAEKRRFLALPDGEHATLRPDGHLDLPVGSVLVKQFYLASQPIETRLMMKYRDGQWAGYSYAWDVEGGDAHLVPETQPLTREWGDVAWSYPTRSNCLGCHRQDRGLGLELSQLEISRLLTLGLVRGAVPEVPPLPELHGDAPLADRARAYLQVNCAVCHTRDGPTPVDLDLRFATPLAETRLCGVAPAEGNLDIEGAERLAPGDPGRSILVQRMRAGGREHMPPIGPRLVDPEGTALVEAWIRGLTRCP
jgi:mono/diheme cytochrome c family protein